MIENIKEAFSDAKILLDQYMNDSECTTALANAAQSIIRAYSEEKNFVMWKWWFYV